MVTRYVDGLLGNDANDGLAAVTGGGHGPKLTLNGCEDSPVVAGDTIWVRPGVYRELWTWDVSGANVYTAGTVTVTNGSTTAQGAGTLWLANVAADYMFHVIMFASGADGVTNGTATFTSAVGNFQANMVGYIIQINTKGAYKIANVGAANSITLSDPNGLGWPAAGAGLTYSVMGGMEPFGVSSVTDNTHLELDKAWNGPTLTGIAYITYNPIRAIGDVTGQIWGVGGTVRITGANAGDTAATRANCIDLSTRSYRILRGFALDTVTSVVIVSINPSYITIEDCAFDGALSSFVFILGANQAAITIRRCFFLATGASSFAIRLQHAATLSSTGHLISNCLFVGFFNRAVSVERVGGTTIRNTVIIGSSIGIFVGTALTVGQTCIVNQCILQSIGTNALRAIAVGELTPNFNSLFLNGTNYSNVTAGANDNTYPALFALPLLSAGQAGVSGFRLPPPWLGELSQWSPVRALAGFGEAPADIFGIKRPETSAKNSWGAVQYQNITYDTTTVRTAGGKSLELSDAGRAQVILASIDRPLKVRVYVYREANYAGINPQLIVKQSGQTDVVITDAGGIGTWNVLEASLTPTAFPGFVVIEYVSNNTAIAGAFAVYFDDSMISSFYNPGKMDNWISDVQPANTPTTSGVSRAFAANEEGR